MLFIRDADLYGFFKPFSASLDMLVWINTIQYNITRARTHGHYLKRTLIPLLMGRKRWTRYQNAWENVPNMMTEKIWRFYVEKYQYARKRARMCVRAFFCKMLKMAWNVCKMNLRRFWAFLFFARALTRGSTHARAISDL